MRLTNILGYLSIVSAAPFAVIPNTQFEIKKLDTFTDLIAEANTEGYFVAHDFLYDQDFRKRDEATAAAVINTINDTGIIWTALDLLADNPSIVGTIVNLTMGSMSSSNSSFSLNLNLATILNAVNISSAVQDIINSGLVTSMLDGLLLDTSFRPTLVDLIYRVVESNDEALKYIIDTVLAKRAFVDEEFSQLIKRADNTGSFGTFISNALGSVLSSSLVGGIANDTLYALNDTGVAVYVVKRFLSTESYINMTAALIDDLTANINISTILSSINFTEIVGYTGAVLDSNVLDNVILGDPAALASAFGKYASAVGDIISDLEDKGLFVDLNNLIFPTTSSTQLSVISTTQEGKVASTSTPTTTSEIRKAEASSSSSAGAGSTKQNPYSLVNKMLIFMQTLLFGGALIIF